MPKNATKVRSKTKIVADGYLRNSAEIADHLAIEVNSFNNAVRRHKKQVKRTLNDPDVPWYIQEGNERGLAELLPKDPRDAHLPPNSQRYCVSLRTAEVFYREYVNEPRGHDLFPSPPLVLYRNGRLYRVCIHYPDDYDPDDYVPGWVKQPPNRKRSGFYDLLMLQGRTKGGRFAAKFKH